MPAITVKPCPSVTVPPLVAKTCLVHEDEVKKVACVRLPGSSLIIAALGDTIRRLLVASLPPGATLPPALEPFVILQLADELICEESVAFDACIPHDAVPSLTGGIVSEKIINCGSLESLVTVRVSKPFCTTLQIPGLSQPVHLTIPCGIAGCTEVILTIQDKNPAPGALPTDCLIEQVLRVGDAITCASIGTITCPLSGGLKQTTLVLIEAVVLVHQQVVRTLPANVPACPPRPPVCPPCPPVCPPCPPWMKKKPCPPAKVCPPKGCPKNKLCPPKK